MFTRGHIVVLVCLALIFPMSVVNAQETARSVDEYVERGGFQNFELRDTDDTIKDILDAIYEQKGDYFQPNVTIYTEAHKFTGTVIQVNNRYVVLLDYDRTGPRNAVIRAMHVVELDDVVGITATALQ